MRPNLLQTLATLQGQADSLFSSATSLSASIAFSTEGYALPYAPMYTMHFSAMSFILRASHFPHGHVCVTCI